MSLAFAHCIFIHSEMLILYPCCVFFSHNCHQTRDWKDFSLFTSSRLSVAFLCCRLAKGNTNGRTGGLERGICSEQREIDGSAVFRLPPWCSPVWRTRLRADALRDCSRWGKWRKEHQALSTTGCVGVDGEIDTHTHRTRRVYERHKAINPPFDNFFILCSTSKVTHRGKRVNVKGIRRH